MEFLENQSPLDYLSLSLNSVLSVSVSLETLLSWCGVDGNNSWPKACVLCSNTTRIQGCPNKTKQHHCLLLSG